MGFHHIISIYHDNIIYCHIVVNTASAGSRHDRGLLWYLPCEKNNSQPLNEKCNNTT